jgi:hypothetical protein
MNQGQLNQGQLEEQKAQMGRQAEGQKLVQVPVQFSQPAAQTQAQAQTQPVAQAMLQTVQRSPLEQGQMQDVRRLLETMFEREEVTVKLIMDCLYEIGAVNLINRRVANQPLNQLARWIARLSRPVFKIFALRWVKRNCPHLITNWLFNQVKFEPRKQIAQVVQAAETVQAIEDRQAYGQALLPSGLPRGADPAVEPFDAVADQMANRANAQAGQAGQAGQINNAQMGQVVDVELYQQQVSLLHSRIRTLTVLLVSVTLTLGGGLAWSIWQRPQPNFSTQSGFSNRHESFQNAAQDATGSEPEFQPPSSAP